MKEYAEALEASAEEVAEIEVDAEIVEEVKKEFQL